MFRMPKGAKPAGMAGSVNELTQLKLESSTSTAPELKLAAKRKLLPLASLSIASPLYTAPLAELSNLMIAFVRFTLGLQALTVPSSVAKIKKAGRGLPSLVVPNTKPGVLLKAVLLKAWPVGDAKPVTPGGSGTLTTRGAFPPKLLYSVDTPAWLSEIQKGLVAEKDIPQG